MRYFFTNGYIPYGLNSNFLCLLLKVSDAITIDKFHPIMLSNFVFKIISKILSSRLAMISNQIVLPNPFGFIRGRYVQDCIATASKCVNLLDSKCFC